MNLICPVCKKQMFWIRDVVDGETTYSEIVCYNCNTKVIVPWNEKTVGFKPEPIEEGREAICIHCGNTKPSSSSLPGFKRCPNKQYDQFVCCLGI